MKKIALTLMLLLTTACTMTTPQVVDHEQDRINHEAYLESIHNGKYDPEYVDDCLAYEELVCEFE